MDSFPGFIGSGISVKEQREPLVGHYQWLRELAVVAELPGVNKEDLRLNADNYSITLKSTAGERLYRKKIELPEEIEPNTGKSTYKDGILEVSLKRKNAKDNSVPIYIG